jgi:hypothetical protein
MAGRGASAERVLLGAPFQGGRLADLLGVLAAC